MRKMLKNEEYLRNTVFLQFVNAMCAYVVKLNFWIPVILSILMTQAFVTLIYVLTNQPKDEVGQSYEEYIPTGNWVKEKFTPDPHVCTPPMKGPNGESMRNMKGSIWQCKECHVQWKIGERTNRSLSSYWKLV